MDEPPNIAREIAQLQGMSVRQLRERYLAVFAEPTRSGNRTWLWRRIAWRIQANAEGDLSERARRRAEELANDADLRVRPPTAPPALAHGSTTLLATGPRSAGSRALMPGLVLARDYKGQPIRVVVLEQGFEYLGQVYRSLSAIAKAITGAHWNGHHFFGLTRRNAHG